MLAMDNAPVAVVRTALDRAELWPLAGHIATADLVALDVPRPGRGSIRDDADDVAAHLDALGVTSAHVVGSSFSAAVALRLAVRRPDLVRTLTAVEAPPAGTAYDAELRELCRQLIADHRARGTAAALDDFMAMLAGADWRTSLESLREGTVEETERGAEAFFAADLPALVDWSFSDHDAATITCPTLVVAGGETAPRFAAMARRLAGVVPGARLVVVPGADHLAASTHAEEVARLVVELVRRAP